MMLRMIFALTLCSGWLMSCGYQLPPDQTMRTNPATCNVWVKGQFESGARATIDGERSWLHRGSTTEGPKWSGTKGSIVFDRWEVATYRDNLLEAGRFTAKIGPEEMAVGYTYGDGLAGDLKFNFGQICRADDAALGITAIVVALQKKASKR